MHVSLMKIKLVQCTASKNNKKICRKHRKHTCSQNWNIWSTWRTFGLFAVELQPKNNFGIFVSLTLKM